jgi:surface protein
MRWIFGYCVSFNQPLDKWNVSNIKDMYGMFYWCKSFNQNISKWDISNVESKVWTFLKCPIEEKYKPNFR